MVISTKRRRRGGFTLLEFLIAGTVLLTVMGASARLFTSTNGLYESVTMEMEANRALRRASEKLREILRSCRTSTMVPALPAAAAGAPTPFASDFTFQAVEGWNAGAVVMGPVQRIFVRLGLNEVANGLDDDDDGLVDELDLVHQPDSTAATPFETILLRDLCAIHPGETVDGTDENANGLVDEPGFAVFEDRGFLCIQLAWSPTGASQTGAPRSLVINLRAQP